VDNFFLKVGIFDFFTKFWDPLTQIFRFFHFFLLHFSIKKKKSKHRTRPNLLSIMVIEGQGKVLGDVTQCTFINFQYQGLAWFTS